MRIVALIVGLLLAVPSVASAACNLIPGASKTFNGALGATTRPFAAGGERVEVKHRPCDGAVSFGATATDHVVSVLFEPPHGAAPTLIVLSGDATCAGIDLTACAADVGSDALCVAGTDAGLELVDRGGVPHLGFRFPDTDALVDAVGDGRTLAGPATIAVTAAGAPLPCGLAAGTCAAQAGVLACVDTIFANDGSCGTVARNPTFPHFTALPPPNDYQADCVNEMPPCTGAESELRFALDAAGNVLLPIDWEGILIRDGPVPVPRLMRGTLGLGFGIPGESFLASFTPEGGALAPIFEPQNDPTVPAGVTTLFGSADAPYTVLAFARRGVALTSCLGGGADGQPCNVASECPGGTCAPSVCVGGGNDGGACTDDLACPGGECGPALFDFSPALVGGGAGPAVLPRLGDGICQEDVSLLCTAGTCGGSGPCVRYKMEALNPVPLEGLQVTDDARTFIVRERLDMVDRTGDGDALDSAVTFRDRVTGLPEPLGAEAACMIPGTPEGRAVIRVSAPPFSFPAVATEGRYLAFLESEGTTNVPGSVPPGLPCEENFDHDRFDGIVRVFELGEGEVTGEVNLAADADPRIDGRSIAISEGRVFFRGAEWMQSERTTVRASVMSVAVGDGASDSHSGASPGGPAESPSVSPNGRYVAFASSAADLVPDDSESYDDVFLRDTLDLKTERVSLRQLFAGAGGGVPRGEVPAGGNGDSRNPAVSADGRFVAFESDATNLVDDDDNEVTDIFVRDRCISNGLVLEECSPSTTRVSLADVDLEEETYEANEDCVEPAISANGRYVAFRSSADSLVADDTNDASQIFVHDRITDHTVVVSVDETGTPGAFSASGRPALSADGRFVAFTSASMLDPAGGGADEDNVFVHDRDHDEDGIFDETGPGERDTEIVSVPTGGGFLGDEGSSAYEPSLSADARYVSFTSNGPVDDEDTNFHADVFVRDRTEGRTERISLRSSGEQVFGPSSAGALSPDGRYVAFVADADIRVDDDNSVDDVYLHDRLTAITERVNVTPEGGDNAGPGNRPAVSTDARTVAFDAFLPPLGGVRHVYLRTNGPLDPNDPFTGMDLFPDDVLDDVVLQVFDANEPGVTTLCPAGDVSVAGGNAAFLRPEAPTVFIEDEGDVPDCPAGPLNADGSTDDDTVVHLWTGPIPAANLGRGGTALALTPTWVAALVSEPQDGTNYNGASGDTDMSDDVVQVHRVGDPPGSWVNVGQAADALDAAGALVAFITPEVSQGAGGTNLNGASGDGDVADRVLQVYDAATASRTNVGVAAEEFVLGEAADDTPCGPVQLVAARTPEAAQGDTNLNAVSGGLPTGDTDTLDDVLHVYDAVSGQLRNPGQAVTPCRIPECDSRTPYRVDGAKVTFLTLESDQGGQDLNGDGTTTQLIIQIYDFCTNTITVIGPVADNPLSDPLIVVEDSEPFASPAGRCHLNVACDPTAALCGAGAFCEADTCDFQKGHCVVHDAVPCGANADCPRCVLREPGACLVDEDCPAGTTCEAAIISVVRSTSDVDDDGIPDARDNCPTTPNTLQSDADADTVGDACDVQTCGNGVIEPGETCDDGNTMDGDACAANCMDGACPAVPRAGCRRPTVSGGASLTLDDRLDDRRDRMRWRWGKGEATTKAEFGDPFTTDTYQLCLYDGDGLVGDATAPAGGICNERRPVPCWHEKNRTFTYRDLDLTPAGVRTLSMTEGRDGRAKIDLRARGPLFGMPGLDALASPVTVQLSNASGLCWEAVYSAPFSMQGPDRFRARSD